VVAVGRVGGVVPTVGLTVVATVGLTVVVATVGVTAVVADVPSGGPVGSGSVKSTDGDGTTLKSAVDEDSTGGGP